MKTLNHIINAVLPSRNCKNNYPKICLTIIQAAHSVQSAIVCLEDGTYFYSIFHHYWIKPSSFELTIFIKACLVQLLGEEDGSEKKAIKGSTDQMPFSAMAYGAKQVEGKINFRNGTLDLGTMKLEAHDWNDFFCYVLPYSYDPNADCPLFSRYLDEVMPDKDAQKVLAEFVGYIFTDLKLEKAAFLYGAGRNGKSVFVEIIEALVGKDNVSHESLSDLCGSVGENHRANIIGKLLNTCSDVSPAASQGDVFKRLVSGEQISAKVLYKDVVTTDNYGRMLFCLNELPETKDHSDGYYRRMLIIPFKVQIPKSKVDPMLARHIISSELPGIMNWALEGRKRLVANNRFSDCSLIDKALEEYKDKGKKKPNVGLLLPPFFTKH